MGPDEDFERFYDIEKKINESVERECEFADSIYLGDLFLTGEEEEKKEQIPRKRGRPKGVKESVPRRAKSKIREILERTVSAIGRLKVLDEAAKKFYSIFEAK